MDLGRLLPGVGPEHVGVRVGCCAVAGGHSGVTALVPAPGSTVGVDSRGGGPATHETDIARPGTLPFGADAMVLTGGSALGLASARGVQDRLAEDGIGTPVGEVRIPIVPAAAIFDVGRGSAPPSVADGRRAADAALRGQTPGQAPAAAHLSPLRGSRGAGLGAWTGRGLCRGGQGCASVHTVSGRWVSALVVANPMGSLFAADGSLTAQPVLGRYGLEMPPADPAVLAELERAAAARLPQPGARNTTIAVIMTDAALTDAETSRLAASAHAGLARAIWPSHTIFDGDTVFALAGAGPTGLSAEQLTELNIAAADALTAAIVDGVLSAEEHPQPTAVTPPALASVVPELTEHWQRCAEQRLGAPAA